jgi:hypothetical protein
MSGAGLAFVRDLRTRLLTLFSGKTPALLCPAPPTGITAGSLML